VGHVVVVRGRDQLLKLLAGEDIDGDEMALSVTVLASLGGRHVRDLAGTVFDADVSALADGTRLLGEGEGGTRLAGLELLLVQVVIISHFEIRFEGRRGELRLAKRELSGLREKDFEKRVKSA